MKNYLLTFKLRRNTYNQVNGWQVIIIASKLLIYEVIEFFISCFYTLLFLKKDKICLKIKLGLLIEHVSLWNYKHFCDVLKFITIKLQLQ